MHPRSFSRLWVVAMACVFLLAGTALADSRARIVRLSYIDGDVMIDRGQGQGFERALMNMPIVEGTRLWTRDGAGAEAEFEDGSTVRLAPNTRIDFSQLGLRSSGARFTTLEMSEGEAYFDLLRAQDEEFMVRFPGREIVLQHSVRFRAQVDRSEARLAVFKGELDIEGDSRSVRVKKNETVTLDLSDPAHYMLASVIQPDPYDSWNTDRQRFRTQYTTASANYNGPYYGWADMNYYGNTAFVPGWGYVWRPYGIGYGWDPFFGGAWAWYPGFGYTFISTYPWGWIPYRYGSWCFIPGFGWAWRPGSTWNTWTTVPVITTTPPGWIAPKPPTGTKTTLVLGPSGNPSVSPLTHDNGDVDLGPAGKGHKLPTIVANPSVGSSATTAAGTASVTMGGRGAHNSTTTSAIVADAPAAAGDRPQVPLRSATTLRSRTHDEEVHRGRAEQDGAMPPGIMRSAPAVQMRASPQPSAAPAVTRSAPAPSASMSAPAARPSVNMGGGGGHSSGGGAGGKSKQ